MYRCCCVAAIPIQYTTMRHMYNHSCHYIKAILLPFNNIQNSELIYKMINLYDIVYKPEEPIQYTTMHHMYNHPCHYIKATAAIQ